MTEAAGEWTTDDDRAPESEPDPAPDGPEEDEAPESPEADDDAAAEADDDAAAEAGERSRLNREAAKYRKQRNDERKRADDYGTRLFHALVAADGRLTDATDMPVDLDLLNDSEALTDAIEALLESKPHLKRKQFGGIGAHERGGPDPISLAALMRKHA